MKITLIDPRYINGIIVLRRQEYADLVFVVNITSRATDKAFGDKIKCVKIFKELIESEPKAYPKHQRERRTNAS